MIGQRNRVFTREESCFCSSSELLIDLKIYDVHPLPTPMMHSLSYPGDTKSRVQLRVVFLCSVSCRSLDKDKRYITNCLHI